MRSLGVFLLVSTLLSIVSTQDSTAEILRWSQAESNNMELIIPPEEDEILVLQTGWGRSFLIISSENIFTLQYSKEHDQASYDYPYILEDSKSFEDSYLLALQHSREKAGRLLGEKFRIYTVVRASYIKKSDHIKSGLQELKSLKPRDPVLEFNPRLAFDDFAWRKIVYSHLNPSDPAGLFTIIWTLANFATTMGITASNTQGLFWIRSNPLKGAAAFFVVGLATGLITDGVMTAYFERRFPKLLDPKVRNIARTAAGTATGATCALAIRLLLF